MSWDDLYIINFEMFHDYHIFALNKYFIVRFIGYNIGILILMGTSNATNQMEFFIWGFILNGLW